MRYCKLQAKYSGNSGCITITFTKITIRHLDLTPSLQGHRSWRELGLYQTQILAPRSSRAHSGIHNPHRFTEKEHSFGRRPPHRPPLRLPLLSAPPAALLGLAQLESISFHLLNPAGPARLRESRTALNNVRDRERQGGRVVLLRACVAPSPRVVPSRKLKTQKRQKISTIDLPKSCKAEGKEKVRHADPE